MQDLMQAGNFRGRIVTYLLDEAESGAVAIRVKVQVDEIFAEGEWHDWREHEFVVWGSIWVVKKDGTINKRQAEALLHCAGWDGSFPSVVDGTWQPTPVSIVVGENTYNGETTYRIDWINEYEHKPGGGGGGGNVDVSKAKMLDSQLGAHLRALAASQKRNADVPKTSPPPIKPKTAFGADVNPEEVVDY